MIEILVPIALIVMLVYAVLKGLARRAMTPDQHREEAYNLYRQSAYARRHRKSARLNAAAEAHERLADYKDYDPVYLDVTVEPEDKKS